MNYFWEQVTTIGYVTIAMYIPSAIWMAATTYADMRYITKRRMELGIIDFPKYLVILYPVTATIGVVLCFTISYCFIIFTEGPLAILRKASKEDLDYVVTLE